MRYTTARLEPYAPNFVDQGSSPNDKLYWIICA